MTNQEILEKAISKAIENGYKGYVLHRVSSISKYEDGDFYLGKINQLLFNHDFAKALWVGDSPLVNYTLNDDTKGASGEIIPNWQYHLQQMVVAKDPIKYLGEHLGE